MLYRIKNAFPKCLCQACKTGGPIACPLRPAVTLYDPCVIETIINKMNLSEFLDQIE